MVGVGYQKWNMCIPLFILTLNKFFTKVSMMRVHHRHLSNIDCLKAHTACFVCLISTVNVHHKKEALKDWRFGLFEVSKPFFFIYLGLFLHLGVYCEVTIA